MVQKENFFQRIKPFWGGLAMVLGSICFSTKAIMIKMAYQYPEIDAVVVLMLRMSFALPFFVAIGWWDYVRQGKKTIARNDWQWMAFLGLVGYYVSSILDFKGLEHMSAGMERLVLFAYPTIVLAITALKEKRRIEPVQYVAVAVTYAGIVLAISKQPTEKGSDIVTGCLFVLGAACTYALYLVESSKLIPKVGTIPFTAITMSFASIAIILNYFVTKGFDFFHYPWQVYILCVSMAIIATVVPTFLLSEGMRLIGPGNASIISTLGPVSTIFLANIFLNENLTLHQYVGTFFVLFGVILITFRRKQSI